MSQHILNQLNEINDLKILAVESKEFATYGCLHTKYDISNIAKKAKKLYKIPIVNNIYVASDDKLEQEKISKHIKNDIYGEMDIEVGVCFGNSYQLNAVEYHNGSEVNIAMSDIVLFLGLQSDISNEVFDSSKCKAFYIPAGSVVELFSGVLHFAPCRVHKAGFEVIVILPNDTNAELESKQPENSMLFKKNKWLLAHPENERMISMGAKVGIHGKNLEIETID